MNSGRQPANNRAFSRRFTAGTPDERAEFLSNRLERLIHGLRLFGAYCNLSPNELTSEVRQFVDLAEIELSEGLKVLGCRQEPSTAATSSTEEVVPTTVPESDSAPSGSGETDTNTTLDQVEAPVDPLLAAPISNLTSPGLSFDSMAQMAEVPEANDLEAILARLQSCSEALDSGELEGRTKHPQPGRDARDLLLGFDVCRMDDNQSENSPQPDSTSQFNEVSTDWSQSKPIATSNDASSLNFHFTEVVQLETESTTSVNLASPFPTEAISATSSSPSNGTDSIAGESQVGLPNQLGNESQQSKPENSGGKNPDTFTVRDSKNENSENSNPTNSISPDNLLEINALKNELNSMLSQFKSPGPLSSSP